MATDMMVPALVIMARASRRTPKRWPHMEVGVFAPERRSPRRGEPSPQPGPSSDAIWATALAGKGRLDGGLQTGTWRGWKIGTKTGREWRGSNKVEQKGTVSQKAAVTSSTEYQVVPSKNCGGASCLCALPEIGRLRAALNSLRRLSPLTFTVEHCPGIRCLY